MFSESSSWMDREWKRMSRKFAGSPPKCLMMSIVAIAIFAFLLQRLLQQRRNTTNDD